MEICIDVQSVNVRVLFSGKDYNEGGSDLLLFSPSESLVSFTSLASGSSSSFENICLIWLKGTLAFLMIFQILENLNELSAC